MMLHGLFSLLGVLSFLQEGELGRETYRGFSLLGRGNPFEDQDHPESPPTGGTHPFAIVLKVETGQELQKITDSHNNFGADRGTLEQSLSVNGTYTDVLVEADFGIFLSSHCDLKLSAGLGGEQLGSHFRIGADNVVLGDPGGFTEQDFNYGLAISWELGAELRYLLGTGPFDVRLSVDYRGGGDNEKDALTEDEYHYWRVRGGAFAGWKASEALRLYGGLHYTYFQAKFRLKDTTTAQDFTMDLAYNNPVDLALGLEMTAGPVLGRVEIDFLGSLSVLVSAGVGF